MSRKEFRNNILNYTIIMSANRSVQAAQRRQTKTPDPPMPGRGPQPSIGSSQMFNAGQQQQH